VLNLFIMQSKKLSSTKRLTRIFHFTIH